ncbi:hypothetical protein BDR04DRAFT_601105 [Suillus decipiens]|nr:hypothetical protein BDR04DRAFT_601105 [Suillus decipiens]
MSRHCHHTQSLIHFPYFFSFLLRSWLFISSSSSTVFFTMTVCTTFYIATPRPDIHDGLTNYDFNILEYPPKCTFCMSGNL